MHFQALSLGIQVPTDHFCGTVHSVFHQACNVRLESGNLLTLLPSEKGNAPHGIRLNTSSQPVFLDFLRVGQSVACRGGVLRADGPSFSIDLRGACLWNIDLRRLCIDLRQPAQARSWGAAWSELKTFGHRSGLSEVLGVVSRSTEQSDTLVAMEVLQPASAYTVSALLQATRDFQLDNAMASIKPLIGLGPGLTPSGDDFLVGYLAGLWSTVRGSASRMRLLTALGSELSQAAHDTNEISYAYLRSAIEGHVSEPIATLAQQLKHTNHTASVRAATQAALQIGHTSGADGVLGLLLGCLAWQRLVPHSFMFLR